jgi:hypothetical protein
VFELRFEISDLERRARESVSAPDETRFAVAQSLNRAAGLRHGAQ